jgi:nucleoside-diphosphate-sugar epimerase
MAVLLVTGGSGMVGQSVAEAAKAAGCYVRLADRVWPTPPSVDVDERVTFDIRDEAACLQHSRGVDAIVHCAAVVGPSAARMAPLLTLAVNVTGTANLVEAAHTQGARLVNVSSSSVYGSRPNLEPLDEDASTAPGSIYEASKLMAEIHCTAHRRTYRSDVASFRTGVVFGPGIQIGEYFLPRALAGEAIHEPIGADHPCDFTYVIDLAEALVRAALAPDLRHAVYNVSGGRLRTRGELAHAVRELVPTAKIDIGPGLDPQRNLRGASVLARAREDFGWEPRFTLESALSDWLRRLRGNN